MVTVTYGSDEKGAKSTMLEDEISTTPQTRLFTGGTLK